MKNSLRNLSGDRIIAKTIIVLAMVALVNCLPGYDEHPHYDCKLSAHWTNCGSACDAQQCSLGILDAGAAWACALDELRICYWTNPDPNPPKLTYKSYPGGPCQVGRWNPLDPYAPEECLCENPDMNNFTTGLASQCNESGGI